MYRYYSENAVLVAEIKDGLIYFVCNKTTIHQEVKDISEWLAVFVLNVESATWIIEDGHIDAFFCAVIESLSDASIGPPIGGEFPLLSRYRSSKPFELEFKFALDIQKKKVCVDSMQVVKSAGTLKK